MAYLYRRMYLTLLVTVFYVCVISILLLTCITQKPPLHPKYYDVNTSYNHVTKSSPIIPNVVHYVIDYQHHAMDFRFYLSIMSAIKYQKPDKIVCHCVIQPFDTVWWIAAKRYAGDKLEVNIIENKEVINSTTLNFKNKYLRNYIRMNLLLDEGGILLEPDVIVLRSVDNLRRYPTVLIRITSFRSSEDILMSVPNSTFAKRWLSRQSNSSNVKPEILTRSQMKAMEATKNNDSFVTFHALNLFAKHSRYTTTGTHFAQTEQWLTNLNKCLKWNSDACALVQDILFSTKTNNSRVASYYHYIWNTSQPRDLNFIEYHSIKSLYMTVNPHKVYFHFTTKPVGNRWQDVLSIKELEAVHHPNANIEEITNVLYKMLWEDGGVLVKFGVLFINTCDPIRGTNTVRSKSNGLVTNTILMVPSKQLQLRHFLSSWMFFNLTNHQRSRDIILEEECIIQFETIDEASDTTTCRHWRHSIWVILHDVNNVITNASIINPMNSTVGEVLRYVLYGVSSVIKPPLFKVPNIVHYIWFGSDKPLEFFHFLSMISAHFIQKPNKIYIHYETLPTGIWWERLTKTVSNIELIQTRPNSTLGGKRVRWIQHQADYTRIRVLREYGGIYVDTDVYFVNSLDPLRVYDCVMSQSTSKSLSNGLILSSKGWHFLKLYEEGYVHFRSKSWNYNSLFYPYLLWLRNRNSIQAVPTRRTYIPSWKDIGNLYGINSRFYWRDNYIVHLYGRDRLSKHTPLEKAVYSPTFYNTTFGEVSRRIYEMYLQNLHHD